MSPDYALLSIDIIKEVNRLPYAAISLIDGDAAKQTFVISDTDFFKPGKEVEVKLRYEGEDDATVFKGVVLKHGIKSNKNGSFLNLELKDKAVKLALAGKSSIYNDMTDSDIIAKIINDNGLDTGKIESTKIIHKEMTQYQSTDWDFILSRADVNGLWLITDDGAISIKAPKVTGDAMHTFENGVDDIIDFEMEADISSQYKEIEGYSWSIDEQELESASADDVLIGQGNLKPADLASDIGADKLRLVDAVCLEQDEAGAWANAKMIKSRMSLLRGRFKVDGNADIKPGDVMEVKGAGAMFNGKTIVTGVRHQLTEAGWLTDVQFGLTAKWFAGNNDIVMPGASGLVPPINGIQIGVVDKFEADPEKHYRVKVKAPAIDEKEGLMWARQTMPDAGNKRGIFFQPEEGDEVVLGFFNDDPRLPVILGSLYNGKNAPPLEPEDENSEKGFVTREKLKILFNDKEKSVTISSPSGNEVTLKDDTGISLKDKNNNEFTLDDKGITIKSSADISIEGDNITIKGSKVDVN